MHSRSRAARIVSWALGGSVLAAAGCGLVQDAPNGVVLDASVPHDGSVTEAGPGLPDAGVALADASIDVKDVGEAGPPAPYRATAIWARDYNTCALLENGETKCWGRGSAGTLGNGDTRTIGDEPNEMGSKLASLRLGTGEVAKEIALGGDHACAMLQSGGAKCWGTGLHGQLGYGDTKNRGISWVGEMGDALPRLTIPNLVSLQGVVANTCAVVGAGDVKCWGEGGYGLLGHPGTGLVTDPPIDFGAGRSVLQLAMGGGNSCVVLDDHGVKCWGFGPYGQNGDEAIQFARGDQPGEMGDNLPYVNLGTGRTAKMIVAGGNHVCAVLDNDRVKCWGQNIGGALGLGLNDQRWCERPGSMGDNLPYVELGTGLTVRSLALASAVTCALLSNDQVKCWGNATFGAAAWTSSGRTPESMGDNLLPLDLGVGRTAKAIAAGFEHVCILLDNGRIRCWGSNTSGTLGYGDTTPRYHGAAFTGDNMPYVDLGP